MMMLMVLVLLGCVADLRAYPDGAPTAECGTMTPNHGFDPQTSAAPYTISLSKSTYKKGDVITVTVEASNNSKLFKGFLLEARSGSSTDALGTFQLNSGESQLQLMDCPGGAESNNAVTHNSRDDKTIKSFKWTAPDSQADIFFQATIVNVKATLWKDVRSSTIKTANSAVLTQANFLIALFLVTLSFLLQ